MSDDVTSRLNEARADFLERAPIAAASGSSNYDAFVSYSHAADGKLAPALRNGLQRFATPWRVFRRRNPVRALRIFQDQASLSANPALWPTIERALAAADWFVLLASPEAAKSPWVEKEIDFWRRNKPVERLLIIQTDGEIAWDHDKNDFDWTKTTALPRRLSTVFTDEPRWIDARWARTGAQATLRDPRFRDLVAELAAPLRGIAKDELIGEDIRQRNRLNFWRNAALAIVTTLMIGAIAAAVIATQQRHTVLVQRDLATSRQLAAEANIKMKNDPQLAALLSMAAFSISDTSEARGSLLNQIMHFQSQAALGASSNMPAIERYINTHMDKVTSVAFSPDGQVLATGHSNNDVTLWDVVHGTHIANLASPGLKISLSGLGLSSVAFSPDGLMLAAASTDRLGIVLWDLAKRTELATLPTGDEDTDEGATSVAFSPDGKILAVGAPSKYPGAKSESDLILWDLPQHEACHTEGAYPLALLH